MKAAELQKGKRYWAWFLHNHIYYQGENPKATTKKYIFKDIADVRFDFSEEDIELLRENK